MIIFCGLRPLSYLCILDISIGSVVLGKLIATGICDCNVTACSLEFIRLGPSSGLQGPPWCGLGWSVEIFFDRTEQGN